MKRLNIYIAGSFTNEQSRKSLERMIEILKNKYKSSVEFFIPMEHKIEGDFQKSDGTWNLSNPEWARRVYAMDTNAIDNCNVMVALYTGHFGTTGTAFEIGYAKAKKIPVILYIPEWAKENNVSLMIFNSAHRYMDEQGRFRRMTEKFLNQFNQK
jgi:nucleoside deoxyribosyltransferase